jgi:hypothetical protein
MLVRMSQDQCKRDYLAKRTADDRSKLEIMRCLNHYVAREICGVLQNPSRAGWHRASPMSGPPVTSGPEPPTSHIERGRSSGRDLSSRYRARLDEQSRN